MNNDLEKTDKACNNIYLIDERMCMSDSFNIINNNFLNLFGSTESLINIANNFNQLYTDFVANSATWNKGALNTNGKADIYNNTYNTISSLSSHWTKEFSVFYPTLLEINSYYQYLAYYKETEIKNWLNFNFPNEKFLPNQVINIYVNLYQVDTFTFSFNGSYNEVCRTTTPPKQVCCTGKSCGDLYRGCNVDEGEGENKKHYCFNAYSKCATSFSNSCATAACSSSGAKTLKLTHITSTNNDRYTSRCVLLKYKKLESTNDWTIQN